MDGGAETDIDGATSSTYTLTSADAGKQIKVRVSFAERGDACRGAADAEKATGKIDWVHYMLSRDGDTASAVTVPVTFDGFAGNDWNLDAAKRTHQSQVRGRERHRHAERQAGPGFRSLGFSNTATLSGTLAARLGVWRRADGVRRVMGTCATAWCGYVCSPQTPRWTVPRRLWVISTHIVR